MLKDYYHPNYVCCDSGCGRTIKSLVQPNKCVSNVCRAKIKAERISEKGVTDTFNYLERLFDAKKSQPKVSSSQKEEIDLAIKDHLDTYNNILKRVQEVRKNNAYDKVDLRSVFSFMHERQMEM